jgi:hypothetical protein
MAGTTKGQKAQLGKSKLQRQKRAAAANFKIGDLKCLKKY